MTEQTPAPDPGNSTPPPAEYQPPQPPGADPAGVYGAPPTGWQQPPTPASSGRRTALIVAGAVVGVLIVLGVVGLLVGSGSDGKKGKKTAGATKAANGSSQVNTTGLSMTLPAGWKAVPLNPTQVQKFLDEGGKVNPQARTAITDQVKSAVGKNLKLFAVRSASLSSGFTDNVNVIVVPSQGATPEQLAPVAKQQLETAGATVSNEQEVTLTHGSAERVDYTLPVQANGKTTTTHGEQVYVIEGANAAIVTLTAPDTASLQSDFNGMLNSLTLS